jgi:hypothetical protein
MKTFSSRLLRIKRKNVLSQVENIKNIRTPLCKERKNLNKNLCITCLLSNLILHTKFELFENESQIKKLFCTNWRDEAGCASRDVK